MTSRGHKPWGCKAFSLVSLNRGTRVEHKEHPSFSRAAARRIARDHLCKNPSYYKKAR